MRPDIQENGSASNGGNANDGAPKFGRLLIVLGAVVLLIVGITFASEAYYS